MRSDGRQTSRRRRASRRRAGPRGFADAVSEKHTIVWRAQDGGDLRDLLYVALLLSLTGEVASVLAGETVLVFVFFLSTMLLCGTAWRAEW